MGNKTGKSDEKKVPFYKTLFFWFALLLILGVLISNYIFFSNDKALSNSTSPAVSQSVSPKG